MSLSVQKVWPGILGNVWKRELQNYDEKNILHRLWNRDTSLWPANDHEVPLIKSNLQWLDLPAQLQPGLNRLVECAKAAEQDGLDHFVFVGMGASNLAVAAVLNAPGGNGGKQTYLLDTMDPSALGTLARKCLFERTLFVFSNKSGKRIETHSLLLYFMEKLKQAGVKAPGRQFVALTEEGSYLDTLAKQYRFRNVFCDPPGIFGRFSGLIHFSCCLRAVTQVDEAGLLQSIAGMTEACGPSTKIADNPAVAIAALLASAEQQGITRIVFLTGPELNHFAYRIAQLVGASTSGSGRGLIPIVGQPSYDPQTLRKKCLVVILIMNGQAGIPSAQAQALRELNIPLIEVELPSLSDFAAEIFKWEIATALACASLHINCFHRGEIHSNLNSVTEQLKEITAKREALLSEARITEDEISLYVEGETRRCLSTINLRTALQTFLELRNSDSYIAILPFFELTPEYLETMRDLRERMSHTFAIPVQLATGPRYVHALGPTYKEGPPGGIFMLLTADPADDVLIPGAEYTFEDLQLALPLAESEALEQAGRRTVRLHLSQLDENSLKQFADVVIQAVPQIRRFNQDVQA